MCLSNLNYKFAYEIIKKIVNQAKYNIYGYKI